MAPDIWFSFGRETTASNTRSKGLQIAYPFSQFKLDKQRHNYLIFPQVTQPCVLAQALIQAPTHPDEEVVVRQEVDHGQLWRVSLVDYAR